MKSSKNKIILVLLILFVCICTIVIFANSIMDFESSHNTSDAVADIIAPNRSDDSPIVGTTVRKVAHLIEFAVFGVSVFSLAFFVSNISNLSVYGYSFFYVLAVAVADEHIQSFSDRTSSTGDIILDFCGGLIGFILVWSAQKLFAILSKRIKSKK